MSWAIAQEMERAANRASQAAADMSRAAGRIEDAVHQLTVLTGHGYGNNIERLIELLETDHAARAAAKETK